MKDATRVLVGTPEQTTTGPVFDAPVGTKLPTEVGEELDEAFKASGYVSSDGLTISPDYSINSAVEWGGSDVRDWLSEFKSELSWKEIQIDYESACHAFGADNVTKKAADESHGERLKIAIGARLPDPRSWVFKMKDGKSRLIAVVPIGQVIGVDEIAFNVDDVVGFNITLKTYQDENGNNIYIYTDDGKVSVA